MNKIFITVLLLLILPLKAFCADGYTLIYKYPDGGLLQIDRSSIYKKYGYLVYYNHKDFENVLSCSEKDVAQSLATKGQLRNEQCRDWYFVNAKIRGEEIKMVFGDHKYSIFDIQNAKISDFSYIEPNTPAQLIFNYISTIKGRSKLRKLEKEEARK